MRWDILTAGTLLLHVAAPAAADTFYLHSGGRVDGRLLNPEQSPRTAYLVQTPAGGQLALTEAQVDRVVEESQLERQYAERLRKLPDTAAAHWDMALRCQQAGLDEQRRFHLEQVLRLEPDHAEARRALGYSMVDGRWLRQRDWLEQQGYQRYRGSWRLPQEVELLRQAQEREEKVIAWRKSLKSWRTAIVKGRDNRVAAEQALRGVRDPMAVPALADMLDNDKELRSLKLAYIEILGHITSGEAGRVLIRHALHNTDVKIRDACLDQLERTRPPSAASAFIAALEHDQNFMVRRAAIALGRIKEPRATLPLIEALITEHKLLVGGSGMQPVFSNQGGGLNVGGRPKIEKVQYKNDLVLEALNVITGGVNYGYDQTAWKNWYVSTHAPPPVDLRREP